jgi:hypothetical protein
MTTARPDAGAVPASGQQEQTDMRVLRLEAWRKRQPATSGSLLCAGVLLGIIAIKLALLVWLGPIIAPDTVGYVAYSDAMLAGRKWLGDADLASSAVPITAFRMVGYPAYVALCREVAGSNWAWLVVSGQILLSLGAMTTLCALRRPFGLSFHGLAFLLVAVGTSTSLPLDASVLSDSVNASLIVLAIAALLMAAFSPRELGVWPSLRIGLLLAMAFLARETMLYLWIPLLPLIVLAVRQPAGRTRAGLRSIAASTAVLLPLALVCSMYALWNSHRTGAAFITTGGQTAMLVPLVFAAKHDPTIFAGSTPLDRAARETLRRYDFSDVVAINQALFDRERQTAPQIAGYASRKLFAAWLEHPAAMLRVALLNLRENQLLLFFRPIDALREYLLWATGGSELGRWKPVARDVRFLPLYLADLISKGISLTTAAGFLLVSPWRAWRERRQSNIAKVAVAVWLLYLGWFAVHATVHVETRYMAPVLPFAILVGISNLTWLARSAGKYGGGFSLNEP